MEPTDDEQPSVKRNLIRRLKLCVVLLIGLCLMLGGVCAYLLREMDRRYSELIDQSVPVLNELRLLSKQALSAQRGILATLVKDNEPGRDDAIKGIIAAILADRQTRASVLMQPILRDASKHAAILEQAGEDYDKEGLKVAELLAQGRDAEANKLRHEKARVKLNLYLNCIDAAANYVENTSQRTNDEYSLQVKNNSFLLLGLSGLPLALAAALILSVVALLLGMWLVLRRAGLDE